VAKSETSPRLPRKAGLKRLANLLDELREFSELREPRPAEFEFESHPFLHFYYRADGTIVADVRLSHRRFIPFEVSEDAGQQEVLEAIERFLEGRPGCQRTERRPDPGVEPAWAQGAEYSDQLPGSSSP